MKRFYYLLSHELKMLAISPATYIAAVIFLSTMGVIYLSILNEFSRAAQYLLPSVAFFNLFWLPVFFVVPLITMRSFAEEHRQGTLESLMTTPTHIFTVVLSKFLSAYLLYIFLWILTLSFPWIVSWSLPAGITGISKQLFAIPSYLGGLVFIALSGAFYIGIGIFASSLTRSQLVAGMLTFSMLFIVILGGRLVVEFALFDFAWLGRQSSWADAVQVFQQLEDFSRGILDTRPLFLYLTGCLFCLGMTTLAVESRT